MLCCRYIIVNTLHKGDKNDDGNSMHPTSHCNTHTPKQDVTVLWNQRVHRDREVTANRPDIITKNKKEKTCILRDVAIPVDRNVMHNKTEEKPRYKN
jgi:hypothetical protein